MKAESRSMKDDNRLLKGISMNPILQHHAVRSLIVNANHVDVKQVHSQAELREFVAGFVNYNPAWIRALYGIRAGFVRLLGMHQPPMRFKEISPADVPMHAGASLSFFRVTAAGDDHWIAAASDKHLVAHLGVIQTNTNTSDQTYYVLTVVHYKHWTGIIYFNVIRPFHHMVVRSMMQAAAQSADMQALEIHRS